MNPKELIAEVEALDGAATSEPWIAKKDGDESVVVDVDTVITACALEADAALIARYRTLAPELARMLREALARCAMLDGLRERDEKNPAPQVVSLKNDVLRLTAERDEAMKRAAAWEIQAQDFRDRVVKAEAEREELRASYGKLKALHAELAADVSLLRHPDHPKVVATHKEIAHALGLDERATADAVLTAIVIMRNQAQATLDMQARARHLENSATLARAELETLRAAQTPRPIAEAPKDGTWILGLWPKVPQFTPERLHWLAGKGWAKAEDDGNYTPTHFLPLPVTR